MLDLADPPEWAKVEEKTTAGHHGGNKDWSRPNVIEIP